jgi:hypothetical protein
MGPIARLFQPGERPLGAVGLADEPDAVCRLDVPYVEQPRIHLSTEAAVRMVVAWHLHAAPRPNRLPRDAESHAPSTAEVMAMLRVSGLEPVSLADALPRERRWTAPALAALLREHGPVVCAGTMHAVVLCGVDPDGVVVHDPWRGRDRVKTFDAFDRFLWWSDADCMVAAKR